MKKHLSLSVAIALFPASVCTFTASAIPTVVDPALSLSIFDTGGQLTSGINGGLTLGGLEVANGKVYVVGANGSVGGTSTTLRLFESTGLGTATPAGAAVPIRLNTRGFDLTTNPADGTLNVVGTLNTVAPFHGIHGFDPAGIAPLTTFATTSGTWATSGLTFDAGGTTALVSTDGVGATTSLGLYSVPAGGPEALVVGAGPLPAGIPAGTDDHVITLDGRTIVVGDGSHDLWDASGGAGTLSLLIDLDAAGLGPAKMGAGGNRATVDPISGDIFVAWGLPSSSDIIRVKADGSSAEIFAIGMPNERIRDLDFGPASDGSGDINLYVSAALTNGTGSIYEVTVPEPSTAILALLGCAVVSIRSRRRR